MQILFNGFKAYKIIQFYFCSYEYIYKFMWFLLCAIDSYVYDISSGTYLMKLDPVQWIQNTIKIPQTFSNYNNKCYLL